MSLDIVKMAVKALDDKKANNIEVIKIDELTIVADYFIDSTGDIILARDAGCEVSMGTEDKTLYNEPSANVKDEQCVNGVTYVFRIRKSKDPEHIDEYEPSDKAISKKLFSARHYTVHISAV